MKKLCTVFILLMTAAAIYSQEIIFEKTYINSPIKPRIENSGIYSISSFDLDADAIYFFSFNNQSVFKYNRNANTNDLTGLSGNKYSAGLIANEVQLNNMTDGSSSNEAVAFKKSFYGGVSLLKDNGGEIFGYKGEEVKVIVPSKNELRLEHNLTGNSQKLQFNFPANLACADLIGIDKAGNLFIIVEKYLSEIPLQIEREVYTFSKQGEILSQLALPNIKYLYTQKDLQIDADGNLYHLMSLMDRVRIIKWSNLTSPNGVKHNYPSEYNYNLHFNNFTSANEVSNLTNGLTKSVLAKASRVKALQIAETYVLHQYECKLNNLAVNDVVANDGDVVRTPDWLKVGFNARVPYKWGGFNTIAQFDAGLTTGKYAGDIVTTGVSSYALGVDCSGFVSRCWQLSYHSSTSDMPNITKQYSSWDDLKPGDAIHKVGHVRLFIKRNLNGTFKVVEAAARNWDVSYWSFSASDLISYTPRYFTEMEENFNTQQPVLLSTIKINTNRAKLNWLCNSTNILGYRVYSSSDGKNWTLILNENVCKTTSAEIDVTGSINFFRIASVKNDSPNYSESDWSNVSGIANYTSSKKALIIDGFERQEGGGSFQGSGNTFAAKYGKALKQLNVEFVSIKNSELLNGNFKLEDYQYIFWVLGDESTINESFNVSEQQLVKSYLNNGGSLFVSGSEIGWDLDSKGDANDKSFYANYLKAKFISDDASSSSAKGIANSSLSGCNINIGQTYQEDYPDEIAPVNGSKLCMQYANGKGAAIEYRGSFNNTSTIGSLIYLSFPLESTADDNSFNSIVSKAIEFFNSAVVSVNEPLELSDEFYLAQNYPNPFNPSTVIRYRIATPSNVTLKVFDMLGKEIATLVNEYKTSGNYSAVFTLSSKLSSGVYFYTLKSGLFEETKRMLIVK